MSCLPVADVRTARFLARVLPPTGSAALRWAMSSVCLAVISTLARPDVGALIRHDLILASQL
eukprot:3718810-Alexandrium_andersonii.AAC.1